MDQHWPVQTHKIRARKSSGIVRHGEIPAELITAAFTKFPHIIDNLKLFWGNHEFAGYVTGLALQSRKTIVEGKEEIQNRKGFPPAVFFAISKIVEHHKRTFPHIVIGKNAFTFTVG